MQRNFEASETKTMSDSRFSDRIDHDGDLSLVFERVSHDFGLDSYEGFDVVTVGYEDFNVIIRANATRRFVKVFSSVRSPQDIQRYIGIMNTVEGSGVNHPKIYKYHSDILYTEPQSGLPMVVMDFVEGETFFDLDQDISDDDLAEVIRQAVLINRIEHDPGYLHDSWAISGMRSVFNSVRSSLSPEDHTIVQEVVVEYEELDIDSLPKAFVHGDLIKSNILKGKDDEIYILDFSVSNLYPRIQELAVIVSSLVGTKKFGYSFDDVLSKVLKMYITAGGQLIQQEIDALPSYARAAFAMEFLGAFREKHEEGNESDENEYWLELGRRGLKKSRGQ
jgi:Ser/Thr protein kinase RdoA (MazF antagonist)